MKHASKNAYNIRLLIQPKFSEWPLARDTPPPPATFVYGTN